MSASEEIVLQNSFCGMGLKFSEAWARRLNNDVGDHVAKRQTHGRFWQRVCNTIEDSADIAKSVSVLDL
jgi:hypothetical protein